MQKITIAKTEDRTPHYLYDLSLPLDERTAKRRLFGSGKDVALYLGVPDSRIYKSRNAGKRVYSPRFDRLFAIRLAGDNPRFSKGMVLKHASEPRFH